MNDNICDNDRGGFDGGDHGHDDGNSVLRNDSSRSESCPICFCGIGDEDDGQSNKATLVRGRCQHEFCIPCIERVLTVPSPMSIGGNNRHLNGEDGNNEDAHLSAPTLGRCPICRAEMSLFDLTKTTKNSNQQSATVAAFQRNCDIQNSPLQGMIFVEKKSTQGKESFHFPQSCADEAAEEERARQQGEESKPQHEVSQPLPYLDLSCVPRSSRDTYWKFDNGDPISDIVKFQPGCHYHHPTRSFHGTILWDAAIDNHREDTNQTNTQSDNSNSQNIQNLFHGCSRWDYILGFSSDLRWIARGIRVARGPTGQVLDVVHFGSDDVRKKQYHRYFGPHATRQHDTASNNSTDRNCRKAVHYPEALPGNIFCQGLTIGLASYHFVSDNAAADTEDVSSNRTAGELAAYISYEHEQVAMWPPLDNGTPVPSRVWFANTSFDASTSTFRGTIDWAGTHHTSWQGDRSWRYVLTAAAAAAMSI